jgi:hypothetical protein
MSQNGKIKYYFKLIFIPAPKVCPLFKKIKSAAKLGLDSENTFLKQY